jgi:hypothetical protein
MTNITKDKKIYGNCQVLSPEGILMFRCDQKKANWYLSRELADTISEEPLVIKLKFEPKGLGNHAKPFGLTEMVNKCVNCGSEEFLTRHHVVPICYRRFFPLELKTHNFHDVLSLCVDCHEKYERKADELKESLALKYNISVNGLVFHNRITEAETGRRKIIRNCNLIIKGYEGVPQSRIEEVKKEIRDYLGRDFTIDDLEEISGIKECVIDKTHGQVVIEQVEDIQDFIEMWRQHFVDNNECKFMPKNWDVKNKIIIHE